MGHIGKVIPETCTEHIGKGIPQACAELIEKGKEEIILVLNLPVNQRDSIHKSTPLQKKLYMEKY